MSVYTTTVPHTYTQSPLILQAQPISQVGTVILNQNYDKRSSPFYYDNTPSGGKVVYYNPQFSGSARADPDGEEFTTNVYTTGKLPNISPFETALTDYTLKSK